MAIDVRLAMGMPGMNVGNMGGMSAAMGPSAGALQEQEAQSYPSVNNQEAFSPWAVMQASARKAGFDKKTVSWFTDLTSLIC